MSTVPRHRFPKNYKCYTQSLFAHGGFKELDGGKIIVPKSFLRYLNSRGIFYPPILKIMNFKAPKSTHCGVFDFAAPEGKVYIPKWMMKNLILENGDTIEIGSVTLPVATFVRFITTSKAFFEITNCKSVFEDCLKNFTCLTTGDRIDIKYNNQIFQLFVLETKPCDAVRIIGRDMQVELLPPVGYKKPENSANEDIMNANLTDLNFAASVASGTSSFRSENNQSNENPPNDHISNLSKSVYAKVFECNHVGWKVKAFKEKEKKLASATRNTERNTRFKLSLSLILETPERPTDEEKVNDNSTTSKAQASGSCAMGNQDPAPAKPAADQGTP